MKFRIASIFGTYGAALGLILLTIAVQHGYGQEAARSRTIAETKSIEKIVRNYLINNPTVIREAMQALAVQEEKEKAERSANLMKKLRQEIFLDPDSPVGGNAAGNVPIVVFFDYNCGYCKSTLPQLQALVLNDPNVKVIFKEFPILGASSFSAAKAALAAGRQGKYVEFHNAILASETVSDEAMGQIAKTLRLDLARFQRDMADPKLDEQLVRNSLLAGSLGINGTPAYIIGDQIIPGAIDAASLSDIVAAQRQKLALPTAVKTVSSEK